MKSTPLSLKASYAVAIVVWSPLFRKGINCAVHIILRRMRYRVCESGGEPSYESDYDIPTTAASP